MKRPMTSSRNFDPWIKRTLCFSLIAFFIIGLYHIPEVCGWITPKHFWSRQVSRAQDRLITMKWYEYRYEARIAVLEQAKKKGFGRWGVPPMPSSELDASIKDTKRRLIGARIESDMAGARYRRIKRLSIQALKDKGKQAVGR